MRHCLFPDLLNYPFPDIDYFPVTWAKGGSDNQNVGDKKNYHYLGTSQKLLRQSECFIMEQYRCESLFTLAENNS